MNLFDADLSDMAALQEGTDGRALDRLMARHKEGLYAFIFGFVDDPEDARELLADTFVRIYVKRDSFNRPGRFKSWLYRIAGNLCKDHLRRPQWRQRLAGWVPGLFESEHSEAFAVPDPRPHPGDEALGKEALDRLEAAIDSLPHSLKAALVLHLIEQRPQGECAEMLGVSVKAVETRVYRARRMLAAKLDRDERAQTNALLSGPLSMPAG